ncbi:DctP family TRAP transporter solute-binding subunit [Candidatus Sumerlaeota bacterium]|nr:DctP family TRAP transporter solute-binding subunit [Candidatus Sumerlaeota bacterium]
MRAIPLFTALALATLPLRAEEMRLSFILDEASDWCEACRVFKERVEERTAGEITVRIVTNAQLSGNSQATELEMVMSGGLEATLESSILLSNVDSAMDAFTVPWRFLNHDEAEAFADGPEGQALLGALEPHGLIGLAWGVNGFRQLTNSRGPVVTPEDLRGLRVRVPDSRQFIGIFRALGADPVTMNFGELMMNLQTGAVEAQENPISVIHSRRLFEVQDHLTVWNYTYDPIALCVNAAWFRGLSEERQAILREAAREAMAAERAFSRDREAQLLGELRGLMEVVELTPEQVAAFRSAYANASPAVSPAQVGRVAVMSMALLILALLVLIISAAAARRAGGRG